MAGDLDDAYWQRTRIFFREHEPMNEMEFRRVGASTLPLVGKAGLADITDMSLRYTDVRTSNEPESHRP